MTQGYLPTCKFVLGLAAIGGLVLFSSCAASHQPSQMHSSASGPVAGDISRASEAEQQGVSPTAEPQMSSDPVCQAFRNQDVDPVSRWVHVFPIEFGGTAFVFHKWRQEQKEEAEVVLEARGMGGYTVTECTSVVVIWITGMECNGDAENLADKIAHDTYMTMREKVCFRIEEVRARMLEECDNARLDTARCDAF